MRNALNVWSWIFVILQDFFNSEVKRFWYLIDFLEGGLCRPLGRPPPPMQLSHSSRLFSEQKFKSNEQWRKPLIQDFLNKRDASISWDLFLPQNADHTMSLACTYASTWVVRLSRNSSQKTFAQHLVDLLIKKCLKR